MLRSFQMRAFIFKLERGCTYPHSSLPPLIAAQDLSFDKPRQSYGIWVNSRFQTDMQLLCITVFTLGLLCLLAYAASHSSQVGPAVTRRASGPPAGPTEIQLDQDIDITSSTSSGSSSIANRSTKTDALHESPSSSHMSSPAELPPHVPPSVQLDHRDITSTATSVAAVPKVRPDVAIGVDETICKSLETMQDS